MAAATGRRPGIVPVAFNHISMAIRAAAVKGFSQSRFVVFFLGIMAFFTAEFFPFDINELAGFVVPAVMTNAAAFLHQTI